VRGQTADFNHISRWNDSGEGQPTLLCVGLILTVGLSGAVKDKRYRLFGADPGGMAATGMLNSIPRAGGDLLALIDPGTIHRDMDHTGLIAG